MNLPALPPQVPGDCWNHIGVWGDRSCGELSKVVHCQNCPVFATAGRRFLDAQSPEGYREEWSARLADPIAEVDTDLVSVLIFRLGDEWLAIPVQVLLEVTTPRPVHRVPHRGGLLAGLVNIRGELHLCVRLSELLGVTRQDDSQQRVEGPTESCFARPASLGSRLVVVQHDGDRWVFPVDEVDQVHRFSAGGLTVPPATLNRAAHRLTRGVFTWRERLIGYLDDTRLFQMLRSSIR